jgi:hypothetical protein
MLATPVLLRNRRARRHSDSSETTIPSEGFVMTVTLAAMFSAWRFCLPSSRRQALRLRGDNRHVGLRGRDFRHPNALLTRLKVLTRANGCQANFDTAVFPSLATKSQDGFRFANRWGSRKIAWHASLHPKEDFGHTTFDNKPKVEPLTGALTAYSIGNRKSKI